MDAYSTPNFEMGQVIIRVLVDSQRLFHKNNHLLIMTLHKNIQLKE